MKKAIIFNSEQEFREAVLAIIAEVMAAQPQQPIAADQPDKVLSTALACEYLNSRGKNISAQGLLKARRQQRIIGVKLNEKEWGFKESELNKFLNKHSHRIQQAQPKQAAA